MLWGAHMSDKHIHYMWDVQCALTHKQPEMNGCIISTLATDVLVLRHQAISIYSADSSFIVIDPFHTQILHSQPTSYRLKLHFEKYYLVAYGLTRKHREMHGCVVSTVDTDAQVLKRQAIKIHNADETFIVLDQFHIIISHLWWTTLRNKTTFLKKWPSRFGVNAANDCITWTHQVPVLHMLHCALNESI